MRWKWLFLCVLVVGAGFVWQNEKVRKELWRELQYGREALNRLAGSYEPWQIVFVTAGLTLVAVGIHSFLFHEDESLTLRIKKGFFRFIQSLPFIRSKIQSQMDKTVAALGKTFSPKPGETFRTSLPKRGYSAEDVTKEIEDRQQVMKDVEWNKGWVSGTAYNCSPELTALNAEVYRKFIWSNPLHVDVFPYVRKMEAEVVQWCVGIFNGGKEACGTMTSGGTESILMAMRAYRQLGLERGIRYPEIIAPISVHCAFNKAADYFRMKLTHIPVDPQTRKVNMKAMAAAISSSTVVLVGSAPHFPHGIIDPIEDIARLAHRNGLGCHVDCCLGGFIVPFMEKAGFQLDPCDFRAKGVTSISADTHKYGYAPKGTSVVLYANKELRHRQFFVDPNWQGGIYATPTIAGSRPGGLIATTWATMMYMGEDGYVDATKKIVSTTQKIVAALKKTPGVYVLGSPKVSVVAFSSEDFDVYRLATAMTEKGWNLNILQLPPSIHLCVTMVHTHEGVAERFIDDIQKCTAVIMKQPKLKGTGAAAIYGTAQRIPDRSLVGEMAFQFIDLYYKAGPQGDQN